MCGDYAGMPPLHCQITQVHQEGPIVDVYRAKNVGHAIVAIPEAEPLMNRTASMQQVSLDEACPSTSQIQGRL